ncbi:MAG: NUDIX hydrolase [Flavobacteriales bacterium]
MPQIYKVFIKNKALLLTENKENGRKINSQHEIDQILQELDQSLDSFLEVKVRNISNTWKWFQSKFKRIKAGGGLVYNENQELLVIERLGYFDLPKGKRDKGEKMKACAIREVQEETGIVNLELIGEKQLTYHCYFCKWNKRWVLKKCYWYKMKTSSTEVLTPQTEEDITNVFWLPKDQIHVFLQKTYPSIISLFQEEID